MHDAEYYYNTGWSNQVGQLKKNIYIEKGAGFYSKFSFKEYKITVMFFFVNNINFF